MILAIDPGTTHSAFVQFNGQWVHERGFVSNSEMLEILKGGGIVHDLLAVEMIACYGMPVGREVFDTCRFIGRIEQIAEDSEYEMRLIFRKDIKLHMCQSPRAKDANIRQALIDRLGKPGTKKDPGATYGISKHLWAALAIAVYAADCQEHLRGEGL